MEVASKTTEDTSNTNAGLYFNLTFMKSSMIIGYYVIIRCNFPNERAIRINAHFRGQ